MTRFAVGFGRAFPRIWVFPIGWMTILLGIAASGRLSRSIVADLIAWWPIWLGIVLAAVFLRDREIGRLRMAGVVPVVAIVFVGLFTWGHVAAWTLMPSASQRLVGPETSGFTDVSLEARINGQIDVRGGGEFLYRVEPVKSGGGIGIPTATEEMIDSSVSVTLQAPSDPGFYSYAGWELILSETPRWSLILDGAVSADLTSLTIDELSVAGNGMVELGAVEEETHVTIDGSFRLVLPPEVPARVVGEASVPASWTPSAEGASSPVLGAGWLIEVRPGGSLSVSQPSTG